MRHLTALTTVLLIGSLSHAAGEKAAADYDLSTAQWEGASGKIPPATVVWEFAKSRDICSTEFNNDLSPYTAIAFAVETNKPSESYLYFIMFSENSETTGPDYYIVKFRLDFKGKKELLVPFDEMGQARKPVGLHKIGRIGFYNRWNPNDVVDNEVVLKLSDIRMVSRSALPAKGPRMSDRELFELLNLDCPGLQKAKAAVAGNDLGKARHELAQHIRNRTYPRWFIDPRKRPTAGEPPQIGRRSKGSGGRFEARIKVDWAGWKQLTFSRSDFETVGKPVGWNWISDLRLMALGDVVGAIVYIDDVKLVGPKEGITVEDFESRPCMWTNVLRTEERSHSGAFSGKWWFMEVKKYISYGGLPVNLSRYDGISFWIYSEEPRALELALRLESYLPDTEYADSILTHKFYLSGSGGFRERVYDFGPRIDWSCNAFTEGETQTVEWNAKLNRHFHFSRLAQAYWQTGDGKYARELAEEINAWIEDCPVLLLRSGNSPYHYAWETLNTAVRLQGAWPDGIYRCILSPAFTDDIIVNIVKSVAEHARHLIKNPTRGNWYTAESLGVFIVGTLFPEYKDAKEWRRIGIERLYNQLEEEVYPDGMEYECALGYNNWVLSEYLKVLEIAKLNDLMDEIPADYAARIEKMFDYLMYDCMPNGVATGLNDSGNANVVARLVEGYEYFPHRSDFIYVASNGGYGERPACDSTAMPYTGHYIMRSGWDRDARYLHMDAGLFGAGHQHEDKLHISLYGYGRQLLTDSGNYMYNRSRWRSYVLLTRAHNTLMVDGMDQCRRGKREFCVWPQPWDQPSPPTDTRWISTRGLDYVVGYYRDGYKEYVDRLEPKADLRTLDSVSHTRRVLFVKPDFWIVHDTLTAEDNDTHTCQSLFHMDAEDAEIDAATNRVTSTQPDAANVGIIPLNVEGLKVSVVKGKTERPVQGWTGSYGKWRPIPTAIYEKAWKGETHVLCVLYPFPAGGSVPIVLTEGIDGCPGMKLSFEDGSAQFYLYNAKPGQPLRNGDIMTNGEVAYVCAKPGDGFRALLVNGTELAAGDVSLKTDKTASASITGYGSDCYVVGTDSSCSCTIGIPGLSEHGEGVEVHKIDRDLNRVDKPKVRSSDGMITLACEGSWGYEINLSGGKSLKEHIEGAREKEAARKLGVDFPMRQSAALPATSGTKIVVESEDISAQGGGRVTITDKKVGAQGKAFLNWDKPAHYIEWKFFVPKAGEYRVSTRYCIADRPALRALVIDGAFPCREAQEILFDYTGGWSNESDDWKTVTLPFPVYLTSGEHTLRMVNLQGSMNLDYFVVHSPDTRP